MTKSEKKLTKPQLVKKVNSLAHQYRSIKQDYEHVLPEYVPDDVKEELASIMSEMKATRALLNEKINAS